MTTTTTITIITVEATDMAVIITTTIMIITTINTGVATTIEVVVMTTVIDAVEGIAITMTPMVTDMTLMLVMAKRIQTRKTLTTMMSTM